MRLCVRTQNLLFRAAINLLCRFLLKRKVIFYLTLLSVVYILTVRHILIKFSTNKTYFHYGEYLKMQQIFQTLSIVNSFRIIPVIVKSNNK